MEITGTPSRNTRESAEKAEREHIERMSNPKAVPEKKEVPTFAEWFGGPDEKETEPAGLFWTQWVIGNKNKPSEKDSKMKIYKLHLRGYFGKTPIDEIDAEKIASFRAKLVKSELSEKRINNICAVLSKSLR